MLYRQTPIPQVLASELCPVDSTHILLGDVELSGLDKFKYWESAQEGDITYTFDEYVSSASLTIAPIVEWPEYNTLKGCWYLVPKDEVRATFYRLYKQFTEEHNLTQPISIKMQCNFKTTFDCDESVRMYPNVSIGKNVVIKPHTTLGGQAFSYFWDKDHWGSIPHCKKVIIGDNVHIGSSVCIDAGLLEDTIIEDDVKIDNLCHIAHDVRIGAHSLIIANAMIGGRTKIGRHCRVAPSTSILNGLTVGDYARTGMHACVIRDVANNQLVYGVPAK